jgi:Rv2525c-like, glycoside hydrolase-like domain
MKIVKVPALFFVLLALCGTLAAALLFAPTTRHAHDFYLGFDRNDYPGDEALTQLRKTFSYAGYWLSPPPGTKTNSWSGKRAKLAARGFGFLLLFNGKLYRELEVADDAKLTGRRDAAAAVKSAHQEGFRRGAVIFLDQEEGGVMLPEQFAYIEAWSDAVRAAGFVPGVYCSGMLVEQKNGPPVTTAADLRSRLGSKSAKLWVANDQCPPSPGCSYKPVPAPSASGTQDALVWQFAQSPRRRQFTDGCASSYAADGMCYAPGLPRGPDSFVDLNTSTSPDPSNGR